MDARIFFSDTSEIKKKTSYLNTLIEEGQNLGDFLEVSPLFETTLYKKGLARFKNKEFTFAEETFALLTLLFPNRRSHWLALGSTQLSKQEYQKALITYTIPALMDPNDPLASLYMVLCYKELGELKKARTTLDLSKKIASAHPNSSTLSLIATLEAQLKQKRKS
jgi:tetratricopeptide (TPR) repeat protein